ncbi:inositol monophosphatase family protein [Sphingomonas sanxanigenens]|uniref:Inositol monophosphatase n=1 Tax=Sphingomonas sanxanigenens DSM 19645 = NX02 TaxID=1123269 RepID=W0A971_9SPHN|nr:inositol monophosphatase family protein [Sphingomonas sanxanigenens]AHE52888.1 hypothetical protein NX02_05765 [Sphingomonas sanxanigenens DSM 19645 = NX02]
MHPLNAQVDALMRAVSAEVVMPMFRSLAADQIEEKAEDDYVTAADKLSEKRLTEGLLAIDPSTRVVGEEAVAADPTVVAGIEKGAVWIVDPIDGTGNYAAGRPPFAIMVALAVEGTIEGGWILDPITGRMVHAALGAGAFVDGERVHARGTGAALPVAAITTRFLPAGMRERIIERLPGRITEAAPPLCAGEQYPRLVLGENDVAMFWRAQPWDHAPGALFLTEAGGRLARFDGSPYRLGEDRTGLLAAASPDLWDRAAAILFG